MRAPAGIDPLADRILQRLAGRSEASEIVLGGYLALQHHLDYRETHDIGARWRVRSTPAAERAILAVMRQVAAEEGSTVRERRFGETLSIELVREGRKTFSFQIAVRSVELAPPVVSAWPPILIETLQDNVGSKMNALVDRGSPRDFLDIKSVVERSLLSVADCWELWARKNPGQSFDAARQKVLFHLSALELRRPLESIEPAAERERARLAREGFGTSSWVSSMYIDDSVYPDLPELPASLDSDVAKADYLQRVCAAWDFHVHPEPETFALFSGWKDIFDRFPLPTSPGYHAFRAWFGWGAVEHMPGLPAPIPLYEHLDQIEGREPDPCAALI